MIIKRPKPKTKPIDSRERKDIVQILLVTSDGELLLVKMILPSGETSYRILEQLFNRDNDLENVANTLLNQAGMKASQLKLLKKGQPFNVGEYAQDIAVYVFIAENAEIVDKPNLEFLVPYTLKPIPGKTVSKLLVETDPLGVLLSKTLHRAIN